MKVFGVMGYSGSGKTTLIEALIGRFAARGLKVPTPNGSRALMD